MLVSYIFEQSLGANKQGDIVNLDPESVKELVASGILREAAAEDMEPDKDDEEEKPDEYARSLEDSIVKRITDKLEPALKRSIISDTVRVPAQPKDKHAGISGIGDLCRKAWRARNGNNEARNQLAAYQKTITGMGEHTDADGGFAVNPTFSAEIWDKARLGQELLYDRVRKEPLPSNTNQLNIRSINETSRASSLFGGVVGYYIDEGDPFTGSKIALTNVPLTLKKLGFLVYITNELLADNSYSLDSYISEKISLALRFYINDGLVKGAGTTQPLGYLNQASLISVAKESNQAAATVVFPNLAKMYARMYFGCRSNAVWIVNQQVMQQLIQLTFPDASGTFPANSLSYNVADEYPMRIFGRPVIECENASALGLPGDISFVDLSQMSAIERPFEVAVSDQIRFLNYETAFRFVFRWDATSPWSSALTPYQGSQTVSPIVTLASRGT